MKSRTIFSIMFGLLVITFALMFFLKGYESAVAVTKTVGFFYAIIAVAIYKTWR